MPIRQGHMLPMGSFATRWLHWLSMVPHMDLQQAASSNSSRSQHPLGSWAPPAGRRGCFRRKHSGRLQSIGDKRNGERSASRLCRFKSRELNVSNGTLICGVLRRNNS
jgi:hypothetical protein